MKIIGLIASLILTFFSIGQKSYYFSEPCPNNQSSQTTVNEKWHGRYAVNNGKNIYEVNSEGIFMVSTTISSISREEIRESTKYDVRDNYIFGVVSNDSLPYVLEGERYFFGIRNKDVIVGKGSENELRSSGRVASEFILNTYENGYFIPSIIRFESKSISTTQLDYDYETTVFDFIADKKSVQGQNIELIVLKPNAAEFNSILKDSTIFSIIQEFKKTK
ncbi:MAG: hypothetical protein QNL61_03155 [Crocinitomicaceae bacterium]